MIEKKTHTTSGSGSAMQRWSMFGARGGLLQEADAGGGSSGSSGAGASTTPPNATGTISQPGTAPAEGGRTFSQEQVDKIVSQRLAEDRTRRGNGQQQQQQAPAQNGQQAPATPPGMMSLDEVERVIERNTAFERVTGQANLSEAQRTRMLTALRQDRPEDVAVWSRQYLEDMGLGRLAQTTPPTPNGTTNGNGAVAPNAAGASQTPATAAPASAAGNRVNPVTSGGLVDFWRMTSPQLDEMGGTQLRQEFEKHLTVGKRLSGAPPVPSVVRRK